MIIMSLLFNLASSPSPNAGLGLGKPSASEGLGTMETPHDALSQFKLKSFALLMGASRHYRVSYFKSSAPNISIFGGFIYNCQFLLVIFGARRSIISIITSAVPQKKVKSRALRAIPALKTRSSGA